MRMANNIRKPPRENGSTSSSTQRSSLWKRLGRRGSSKPIPIPAPSNTKLQQSAPSGSIPLKSSNELYETIPVEPDNGDARSLSAAKRSQRMNNNNNDNNNTKNNTTNSKGGGSGSLMRKLKSSFRKSSANSDQNQLQLQLQKDIDDNDNDEGTMLPDHQRSPISSQRPLDPSSPAYSTDSFVTVEVGKLYNI
jgi:hypothetical protein